MSAQLALSSDYSDESKGMVVTNNSKNDDLKEQEHQKNLIQLQQQLLSMGKRTLVVEPKKYERI